MSDDWFPIVQDRILNPAILLFGNRLFIDQSPLEYVVELLLLMNSQKKIAGESFSTPLPDLHTIREWPKNQQLLYAPKARLNLKLFAFLSSCRLETRHETHRRHYCELVERLSQHVDVTETGSEQDVMRALQNLLSGFQGTGSGRTWCAQSFFPISPGLLAGETIWNETEARRKPPASWVELLRKTASYLTMNRHRFLARGGEVLFLQLCNALRQRADCVRAWVRDSRVSLEDREQDPEWLHEQLQRELGRLFAQTPHALTAIAEFVDTGVEKGTAEATDRRPDGEPRWVDAGWCAAESWPEGYLFAVDLLRLCEAELDPVERLQLLESACGMQVLRSLAAQSARRCGSTERTRWPGYRLAVSGPSEQNSAAKRISGQTVRAMESLIYHAIRSCSDHLSDDPDKLKKNLREADTRYGGKLFVRMAKCIGMLVPRRGAGARFTLNERLLRLLVLTTVPRGGRLTYDRFKQVVEARHGLTFDADGFDRASRWARRNSPVSIGTNIDAWLQDMLDAAGMLMKLSDSCALVLNTAGTRERRGDETAQCAP